MCERVEEFLVKRSWSRSPDGPGAGGGAVSTPQSGGVGLNHGLSPLGKVSPGRGDSWEAVEKEERTFSVPHTLWSGAPRELASRCPARRVIVSG